MWRTILTVLIGVLLLREGKPDSTAYEGKTQDRPKKKAPAHRYKQYEHSSHEEHRTAEQYNWRRQNVLACLTTLFAAGAVGFAFETFVQARRQADAAAVANRMNAESGRAWLGPRFAHIVEPLKLGTGLNVSIEYMNFGREPAREMLDATRILFFTQEEWDNGTAAKALRTVRNSCFNAGNDPHQNPPVLGMSFPNNGQSGYSLNVDSDQADLPKERKLVVTQDIISGRAIATVSGCFVYQSAGKIRHTSFCYNYQAGRTAVGGLAYCTVGNDAD